MHTHSDQRGALGHLNVRNGRPQAWARGHLPPENVVKFCALVVTVKRSVEQLFMHYFHNFSSAFGGSNLDPAGGLSSPEPLICLPLENILQAPMK